MSSAKRLSTLAGLTLAVCLTVVPLAGAYNVPGAPGTPGGKPTAASGGSHTSKSLTAAAAQTIAGYTGLELALRTPQVTFRFPGAGVVGCSMTAGRTALGSGSARRGRQGSQSFPVLFTDRGRSYMYNHNGQAISVTVKCTFTPRHGSSSTSRSTVVLDA